MKRLKVTFDRNYTDEELVADMRNALKMARVFRDDARRYGGGWHVTRLSNVEFALCCRAELKRRDALRSI